MAASKKTTDGFWVPGENGYERTDSLALIKQSLLTIQQKHKFLVLIHKDYQSGSTVLISAGGGRLTIDKPIDWPGRQKRIRVVFKDEADVWNYFIVTIVQETKDTLKTKIPTELFRLQRRANFRIKVPSGSMASFYIKEENYPAVKVSNLSIGGMLICMGAHDKPEEFKGEGDISDIVVHLPEQYADSGGEGDTELKISKGAIVRSFVTDAKEFCMGVQFYLRVNEEKKLMHYVRHRELEVLRKGIL